jgi:hypothetical protein
MDDADYFHRVEGKTPLFKIGVMFAIATWSLWALAGHFISNLDKSYTFLIISFILSTIWVLIAAGSERKFDRNHGLWLLSNIIYVIILAAISWDDLIVPFNK